MVGARLTVISSALLAVAVFSFSSDAKADNSPWLGIQGGVGWLSTPQISARTEFTALMDLGMGTDPSHPYFWGFGGKMVYFAEIGPDITPYMRVGSSSFAKGELGWAVDVGGYMRWWETPENRLNTGFDISASLGLPYAITFTGNAKIGLDSQFAMYFGAGIDLLRLTVHSNEGRGLGL